MKNKKIDYVDLIYNEKDRPLTSYPAHLTAYLVKKFKIKPKSKLLDIGCGRGEFLKGFIDSGLKGYGVDRSQSAKKYCPEAELFIADLEKEKLPFPDNYFDVVYSKSVIEHFYYPEKLVEEIYRVLKPGGMVITMCPAWEFNYRIYFEDFTHRTPFMKTSLYDIHLLQGFKNAQISYFKQLPILWGFCGYGLNFFSEITRICVPNQLKKYSKWIRFSKEIMLLATALKPLSENEKISND